MQSKKPKIIMITSIAVMLTSVAIIAIGFIPNPAPKPKYECAPNGTPSSGFADETQNNCPITVSSLKARLKWEKGIYGEVKYTVNRTMAVIFLIGAVGLTTGLVMNKKAKKAHQTQSRN